MGNLTRDRSKNKKVGRPKGSKSKTTILREAIQGGFETSLKRNFTEIMGVLIGKAKDGDMAAMKLLFDKVIPNAQSEDKALPKDLGINIIINDMSPKEVVIEGQSPVIEGETVEEDKNEV